MKIVSIRWKLTLLYVITVAILLAVFIGADVIGLKRNLMQQAGEHAISQQMMHDTWTRALWEHVSIGALLLVVVFVLGYLFIRRALKPVREITHTARQITAEDLSLRVDAHGDRNEIGQLADTLNDMIERLQTSFVRIKQFSADAAHELSTPLTILRGEVELALRKERSAESYHQTLTQLLGEIDQLSSIIDNLLLLSQIDNKRVTLPETNVALDDVIMKAYEETLPISQGKGIALELERIDTVSVQGHEHLLKRLVVNLLTNAVKFSSNNDRVAIRLTAADAGFELSIQDQGIGIPQKELPFVFDRFYRVEKSRTKRAGGCGLGLSIAKEIADLHGLKLSITSEVGKGTTVSLTS